VEELAVETLSTQEGVNDPFVEEPKGEYEGEVSSVNRWRLQAAALSGIVRFVNQSLKRWETKILGVPVLS